LAENVERMPETISTHIGDIRWICVDDGQASVSQPEDESDRTMSWGSAISLHYTIGDELTQRTGIM